MRGANAFHGILTEYTRNRDREAVKEASPAQRDSAAFGGDAATVIAFYLPQYHRIPENDVWWGEGFTDWVNVRRAQPLFAGHVQPRVPTALGYYDLLDAETHAAQASLAKSYGIGAFCYYAYWFKGRRLLERPLDVVLANRAIEMPYAICWANEPWSRRWDGSENEVLVAQSHSPAGDPDFVDDFAAHFADDRYLRVQGRPLLLLYRPKLLLEPRRTTDALRQRFSQLGLPEPFLASVQSFEHWDPSEYGFDGAVEFPPHGLFYSKQRRGPTRLSYEEAMLRALSRPVPSFPWFRGVMPDWDNTPRRERRGFVFEGATPLLFRKWLEGALEFAYAFGSPSRRMVFVNAWNEWAEGAYLEPDRTVGYARLESVRDAIKATLPLATDHVRVEGLRQTWLSRHVDVVGVSGWDAQAKYLTHAERRVGGRALGFRIVSRTSRAREMLKRLLRTST